MPMKQVVLKLPSMKQCKGLFTFRFVCPSMFYMNSLYYQEVRCVRISRNFLSFYKSKTSLAKNLPLKYEQEPLYTSLLRSLLWEGIAQLAGWISGQNEHKVSSLQPESLAFLLCCRLVSRFHSAINMY